MKRNKLWASLLGVTALSVMTLVQSCSNDEEPVANNSPKTYTATVVASKDSLGNVLDDATRAVFVGGNTFRYANMWDNGDKVRVYKDGVYLGTLEPSEADKGTKQATLTGELTGSLAAGDYVDLYLTGRNDLVRDYTGQKGTINDMSANFGYQKQRVQVTAVDGSSVTLAPANMYNLQAYLWLILVDEEGNRLHPSQVTVNAFNHPSVSPYRQLVTSVAEDGTPTYGDIVINTEKSNGEYPGELFIALLNEGFNESNLSHYKVVYYFTAIVDGETYVATKKWNFALPIGQLYSRVSVMRKQASSLDEATATLGSMGGKETFTEKGGSATLNAMGGTETLE